MNARINVNDASNKLTNKSSIANKLLLAFALVLLVGIGVAGGILYQKSQKSNSVTTLPQNGSALANGFGGRRGFNGPRPTIGTVSAVSPTSITIKDQSGTDKTFSISSSTVVTDSGQTVAVSDIKVNDTVFVMTSTSDATAAVRISLNPSFRGGPPTTNQPTTN